MRARVVIAVIGMALVGAAIAVPVVAHHAFSAEFDANRPLHLEGSVT